VLDEAHEIPGLVIEQAGTTIGEKVRKEWELPPFPNIIELDAERQALMGISINPYSDAIEWLSKCHEKLGEKYKWLSQRREDKKYRKLGRKCELLGRRIADTILALHRTPDDWFIRSGPKARRFRGGKVPGFVCKPLTARHHCRHYFLEGDRKVVMMSATIGKIEAFTEELGIEKYSFRQVEGAWPPETRPIHVYDAPKMSKGGLEKDQSALGKQADLMAEFIKDSPNRWSGLILVTRRAEVGALARRLAKRGLEERVFPIPGWDDMYIPTNEQVELWHRRLHRIPNSIAISCNLWTGYDGFKENLLLIGKVPFGDLSSAFNYTRMARFRKTYNLEAGNLFSQGLGRIRRGEPEHYDVDGWVNKKVAVFDGSWTRLKSYIPEGIKASFVRV